MITSFTNFKIIKFSFQRFNFFLYLFLFKITKIKLNLHIFFLKNQMKSFFYFSNFLFLFNLYSKIIFSKLPFKYYVKLLNGKLFLKFNKKQSNFTEFNNCFNFNTLFKKIIQ